MKKYISKDISKFHFAIANFSSIYQVKLAITSVGVILTALIIVLPALAQENIITSSATSTNNAVQQKVQQKAETEIDRRINSLNTLNSRIEEMKKLSESEKTALQSTVQGVISNLGTLQEKIASETDSQTLKTYTQSITKAYRVYALVMPQTQILSATDRIQTSANTLSTIANKLQIRINQASSTMEAISLQTQLADINIKIANAKTQAQAAISEVTNLLPDQGDKTIAQSNLTALKDARTKIVVAQKDLKAARDNAREIIKSLTPPIKANKATSTIGTSTPE